MLVPRQSDRLHPDIEHESTMRIMLYATDLLWPRLPVHDTGKRREAVRHWSVPCEK